MKKIRTGLLSIFAFVAVFPVAFLVIGSFMGKTELGNLLGPVLDSTQQGYVSWRLIPQYPTLRSYVELLLDSPEFLSCSGIL